MRVLLYLRPCCPPHYLCSYLRWRVVLRTTSAMFVAVKPEMPAKLVSVWAFNLFAALTCFDASQEDLKAQSQIDFIKCIRVFLAFVHGRILQLPLRPHRHVVLVHLPLTELHFQPRRFHRPPLLREVRVYSP